MTSLTERRDETASPPAATAPAPSLPARPRRDRWPARLDLLESVSGLFLALFLVAHMAFVASILISHDVFYAVARFFEGAWLLGRPQPALVSLVVAVVLAVLVAHAWLALRKFPGNLRAYRSFAEHRARLHHGDTSLWWLQLWTGFALFFLTTIHLYGMLTQPALIGPYESADRVWTGSLWPLYLTLLFVAEIHAGIGLYRLAVKWGDLAAQRARLQHARRAFSAFFITLGLVTLAAYIDLGRAHAERAGERYVPTAERR